MKRAAGFTLIELVIVIVILGILGAVAAPRFLNLQGDAYGANLKSLKSSMESAATLVNSKAILDGKDKSPSVTVDGITSPVTLTNGFPNEAATGILAVIDIENTEVANATEAEGASTPYVSTVNSGTDVTIWPTGRYNTACKVVYTPAVENQRPRIVITDTAC